MSTFANTSFNFESWKEQPIQEKEDLPKMSRVNAVVNYQGDIEGEGQIEYLMVYREDGSATFIGLERVRGGIAGYQGSFVLQHAGVYEDGTTKSSFSVIPGSGTGKLSSLRGHGEYAAGDRDTPMTMQYDIDGVEEGRETLTPVPAPAPVSA